MEQAKNLYFSKEHTWIKVEGNTGIVGISDFAQGELGEIVYVDLPNIGDEFEQDEVFGSVEALKTVSDLFMPLSGEIVETNQALLDRPTLVNDNPFSEGWMVKIKIENEEETKDLLNFQGYEKILKR